jgi:HEAT repeat protein
MEVSLRSGYHEENADQRRLAEQGIREIGSNGFPVLLQMLRAKHSPLGVKARAFVSKFLGVRLRPDWEMHQLSFLGFHALGVAARGTVPELVYILEKHPDWPTKVRAVAALGEIGCGAPEAIPVVLPWLESPDPLRRASAASLLGKIGLRPDIVIPALQRLVTDPVTDVRKKVFEAFGGFGTNAWTVVPDLIREAHDQSSPARQAAIRSLGKTGPPDSVLPALLSLLHEEDQGVRVRVVQALGDLGPGAHSAIPELFRAFHEGSGFVRSFAMPALVSVGAPAEDLVPLFVRELKADPVFALDALGRLGKQAAPAVPDIRRLLADPDSMIQAEAKKALRRITEESEPPLPR